MLDDHIDYQCSSVFLQESHKHYLFIFDSHFQLYKVLCFYLHFLIAYMTRLVLHGYWLFVIMILFYFYLLWVSYFIPWTSHWESFIFKYLLNVYPMSGIMPDAGIILVNKTVSIQTLWNLHSSGDKRYWTNNNDWNESRLLWQYIMRGPIVIRKFNKDFPEEENEIRKNDEQKYLDKEGKLISSCLTKWR